MAVKILFIDTNHPVLHETLISKGFNCVFGYSLSEDEIIRTIHEYDGIVIRSRIKIDKEIIDKGVKLKFIARAGAGMENIDAPYAELKGIKCLHAPEGNRDAVAEQAIGMILMLFNNLMRADKQVRTGKWIREGNRGIELMGKTVGIVGYGNMGSAFAQRLQGFGVEIIAYDKYKKGFGNDFVKEVKLAELFEKTDILSLHIPLTKETNYMVTDEFINSFKKNIYIINTSRGKVLKTFDLMINMELKKVLGVCLDVLEYETLSFENLKADELPEPFQYLINSDKVILSPHIAGWTHESNYKIAKVLAEKIISL